MKTSVKYRDIWQIAFPIILGSIAQNVINITDTAFLGRVGEIALGASAIGGLFYLAVLMLGFGFGIGSQIIIARRNGEKAFAEIGRTTEHTFYFLLFTATILFLLLHFFSPNLLSSILKSEDVLQESIRFFDIRIYGLFFAFVNITFRSFYIGIGKTRVITWTTIVMAITNIFLDYALIFGHFSFPELGIRGAAIASVSAEIAGMVFFIVYTYITLPKDKYNLFLFIAPSFRLLLRVLKTAVPVMMQNFISLSSWFIFFLFVEQMGEHELAISNIIRSIYIIMLIPVWGFAAATNTLVSNLIGQHKQNEVMPLIFKIQKFCVGAVVSFAIIMAFIPRFAIQVITNNPELINDSVGPMYVVIACSAFLGGAFILFSGVSGTGKTIMSLFLETIALALYLTFAFYLSNILKVSITWVWSSELVYAVLLGSFSLLYLKFGKWKFSRV